MLSVSEVLRLLNQMPIWRAVTALPKRIAEIEDRLMVLERGSKAKAAEIPTALACPTCDARMKVVAESPHPEFGFAGMKLHEVSCEGCNSISTRDFQPGKGYQ
jgi:hypothetical protein